MVDVVGVSEELESVGDGEEAREQQRALHAQVQHGRPQLHQRQQVHLGADTRQTRCVNNSHIHKGSNLLDNASEVVGKLLVERKGHENATALTCRGYVK